VLDDRSWALLDRVSQWLDHFKRCFGHQAQRVSLRQYMEGLLGDSRRKTPRRLRAQKKRAT
jgi:hypothetical protein